MGGHQGGWVDLRQDGWTSGRMGGPQMVGPQGGWVDLRVGLEGFEEEKNLLLLLGIKPRFLGRPARGIVTVLTELPRFLMQAQVSEALMAGE
jgi:hypothetical protein